MKRRYIVTKPLKLDGKNYNVGAVVPHNKLKFLTETEKKKNIYIQDFSQVRLPFNWGLIFLSTEFPHPEGERIPCRDEIELELLSQMRYECGDTTECDWDFEPCKVIKNDDIKD